MLARLGDPPTPVPEPFAGLLLEQVANHRNTDTIARWLFPGRWASQPLHPATLREQLRQRGFMTSTARPAAPRQLVLQAPAPVIARSLGFHANTATRVAAEAEGTWNHYAPGDHTK